MRIETKGIVLLIALLPLHASAEPVVVRTSLEAQIRAVANLVDDDDRDTGGVQVRRALLDFQAERETGRASGRIRLSADRGTGAVSLDYCYLDMTPTPRWLIRMGQFKPRFLREEIVAYTRQIASERSYVSDYFTVDLTQGIEASRRGARWLISAALHDGAYAAATDFNADGRDLAGGRPYESPAVGRPAAPGRRGGAARGGSAGLGHAGRLPRRGRLGRVRPLGAPASGRPLPTGRRRRSAVGKRRGDAG
jgi:hypothetical protein